MAIRLTSAADYAIRAMLHIASLPEGGPVQRQDIARVQKIPASFVSKVLQSLVRAGLLRSYRGSGGGFALAREASEINLLQVVEAIEGPLALNACAPEPGSCVHSPFCPADQVWVSIQRQMADTLRDANLEQLISCSTRNGIGRPQAISQPVGQK